MGLQPERPLGTAPIARARFVRHDEIEQARGEYPRLAGWDAVMSNPTAETLGRLGIEFGFWISDCWILEETSVELTKS